MLLRVPGQKRKTVLLFRENFRPLPSSQAFQRGGLSTGSTSWEEVAPFNFLPEEKAVGNEVKGYRARQDKDFTGVNKRSHSCVEGP